MTRRWPFRGREPKLSVKEVGNADHQPTSERTIQSSEAEKIPIMSSRTIVAPQLQMPLPEQSKQHR
jgi:hypothetical protein